MSQFKPITIIGGGLAGLSLGIALRRRSVPVVIREAGKYPRHRVCGEFISGRGQESLERLGVLDVMMKAGGRFASTASFFIGSRRFPAREFLQPALCLSRYTLDSLLVERFCKLGGELKCESRWPENQSGEGIIRASGRQSQSTVAGWRWFGLKAHAKKVQLSADLEMHVLPDAYVGLCRLSADIVNVCGLFRRRPEESDGAGSVVERLQGPEDSVLRRRLKDALWMRDSVCAVGGLSLRPQRADGTVECRIGDAQTMIAPVTGNGMSMAFESAELAVDPLIAYSRNERSWRETTAIIARSSNALFDRRLAWAWRLQQCLFSPALCQTLIPLALRFDYAWRFLFAVTR